MEYLVELLLAAVALAYLLYYFGTKNHDYWKKRGVPCPPAVPFLGTMKEFVLSTEPPADIMLRLYNQYAGEPYVGLLNGMRPALLARDPELIKAVLTKDFEFFPDRPLSSDEVHDPMSANLLMLQGMRWKSLRIKLSPTFSSGKIKSMFPLMVECTEELDKVLDKLATTGEAVEMRDVLSRFSTDIIGSCAFGVKCNAQADPHAEFHKQGMKIFDTKSFKNKLRFSIMVAFPNVTLLHKLANNQPLNDFFLGIVKETVKYRIDNNVKRNDFMDLMIELKQKGKIVDDKVDEVEDPFLKVPVSTSSEELKFTDNLMTAQAFVFFAAGFETSSTTMSFCLAELAHNADIQENIRSELDRVLKKHGKFTYEALSEMTYLDKVVSETLRKHSPVAMLARKAIKPYKVPDSKVVLEPGSVVFIPVPGLHHDPAYYPDPERFDPERFGQEAVAARPGYTFLPFGEGPRICIGMRFGLLQTKLGLAAVLRRYQVLPSPLSKYPIQYAKGTFVSASTDGCHVILKRRD